MPLRDGWRFTGALAIALALGGCQAEPRAVSASAPAAEPARAAKPAPGEAGAAATTTAAIAGARVAPMPPMWRVSDADNEIYLLGSFHALKPSDYPVGPEVDTAFADAEAVAFEVAPEELASPQLAMAMVQAAMQPAGRTLQDSLDAQGWQRLQDYAGERGLPLETYQAYEPWFVALLVSLGEMARIGYEPSQGLDQQLVARAQREGKRTMGLETGASQIAVLDGMSEVEQRQSLAEALDDAEDFRARIDKLHRQWREGDEAGLSELLTVEFKRDYPQLYRRINTDRNNAWLPKLRRLLDEERSDDTLVVVGTLHLLGPDGLVSLLQAQGYRVQRL